MYNININIDGVTEENRFEKFSKFDDVVNIVKNGKKIEKSISTLPDLKKSKNPRVFNNIKFKIDYSTKAECLKKIDKALRIASFSLDVPLKSSVSGEGFNFKAQEGLTDKWCGVFSKIVRGAYDLVIKYFGLPEITIMSKAGELTWKGKILYSPENGEPIKKSEWDSFVKALEKFLNRNIANAADKIVLDSTALGKILDRMLKTNSLENIKKLRLENIKYAGKTFDWISESVRNMKNTSGDFLKRNDYARIQIMQDSAATKIQKVSDAMKSDIRQILVDGALERKSKTQVSQMIFDKMIGHNRDFQRIADTEIQRASTNAFVKEEVYKAEEGEKVYFQRLEVIDDNTCEYCKKINGRIAIWSDIPLSNGAVKDKYAELAIWEGKEWNGKKIERISDAPVSVCHPYCRGVWIRYYPELDSKGKNK